MIPFFPTTDQEYFIKTGQVYCLHEVMSIFHYEFFTAYLWYGFHYAAAKRKQYTNNSLSQHH